MCVYVKQCHYIPKVCVYTAQVSPCSVHNLITAPNAFEQQWNMSSCRTAVIGILSVPVDNVRTAHAVCTV